MQVTIPDTIQVKVNKARIHLPFDLTKMLTPNDTIAVLIERALMYYGNTVNNNIKLSEDEDSEEKLTDEAKALLIAEAKKNAEEVFEDIRKGDVKIVSREQITDPIDRAAIQEVFAAVKNTPTFTKKSYKIQMDKAKEWFATDPEMWREQAKMNIERARAMSARMSAGTKAATPAAKEAKQPASRKGR